jgi:hypothetical protein
MSFLVSLKYLVYILMKVVVIVLHTSNRILLWPTLYEKLGSELSFFYKYMIILDELSLFLYGYII